jgi:hypothetical protein
MKPDDLRLEARSVVLLGSFNPPIFHPQWFESMALVPSDASSDVELITPDVTKITLGGWLEVVVLRDRFTVQTTDPLKYETMRDLVVSTFTILAHTPLTALGLNHDRHYRIPREEDWHALGHILAPKDMWSTVLEKPGMRSLTIEGVRPDKLSGAIYVKVEPSQRMEPGEVGIFFGVNDHFNLDADAFAKDPEILRSYVEGHWTESANLTDRVIDATFELVGNGDSSS